MLGAWANRDSLSSAARPVRTVFLTVALTLSIVTAHEAPRFHTEIKLRTGSLKPAQLPQRYVMSTQCCYPLDQRAAKPGRP